MSVSELALLAISTAGCGQACQPGDNPALTQELVAEHARETASAAGTTCLPANPELGMQLGALDGVPVVCATERDSDTVLALGVPVGCWTIDLDRDALAPIAPAILPGHSAIVALQDGCALGYCFGPDSWNSDLATSNTVFAPGTDGRHIAISVAFTGIDIYIVDRISHAVIRHIVESGPDTELTELGYLGDRIYRVGTATMMSNDPPGLTTFRDDGTRLGLPGIHDRNELFSLEPVELADGGTVSLERGRELQVTRDGTSRRVDLPTCK